MRIKRENVHPEPRMPFTSSVPPTLAEERVAAHRWERRGLLGRLVRGD